MGLLADRLDNLLNGGGHLNPIVDREQGMVGYWLRKHGLRFFLPVRQIEAANAEDWHSFLAWWRE